MKLYTGCIHLAFLSLIAISACQKENNPPVLQSLTASSDSVYPGDTVLLKALVDDVDGDSLVINWSSAGGTFLQTSSLSAEQTNWVAPSVLGDNTLTVSIDDGKSSIQDSVLVYVKDDAGTFKDYRDGTRYTFSIFGSQIWMTENLAYLPKVGPSIIGSDTVCYYYVYDYEGFSVPAAKSTEKYQVYGVLYNWVAAMAACPEGWHLPSDEEWKSLEVYLGMLQSDANKHSWRNTGQVGMKMKSLTGWANDGNGDNSSGFNALPAGMSDNDVGGYHILGAHTYFWSSSPLDILPYDDWPTAYLRHLITSSNGVHRTALYRNDGYSVRCVKDE